MKHVNAFTTTDSDVTKINPKVWGELAGGEIELSFLPHNKIYLFILSKEKISIIINPEDLSKEFMKTMTKYCQIAKEIRGLI